MKKIVGSLSPLLFLYLLIFPGALFAQNAKGIITGRVVQAETNNPLVSAHVQILHTFFGTATDVNGRFRINLRPGQYTLRFGYISHYSAERKVTLVAGDSLNMTIFLTERVEQLGTLTVMAEQPTSSSQWRMTARTIKNAPALAEPDILRSAALLPGVMNVNDWTTNLNIRGGASDQNRFLLDGVEIFQPSHVRGLFSAFNVHLIDHLNIYTADFPAKHGGQLSGLIDASTLVAADTTFFSANLGLTSGLFAASRNFGPLSVVLGGRRTWLDLVVSDPEKELDYNFHDFNLKLGYALSNYTQIEIMGFENRDVFDLKTGDFFWGNQMGALRLRTKTGAFSQSFLLSGMRNIKDGNENDNTSFIKNTLDNLTVRYDVRWARKRFSLEAGAMQKNTNLKYNWLLDPAADAAQLFSIEIPQKYALNSKLQLFRAYTGLLYFISPKLYGRFFLRTASPQNDITRLEPGVTFSWQLKQSIDISASVQRNHQFLATGFEPEEFALGNLYHILPKPMQADMTTMAGEFQLNPALLFKTEAYFKKFNRIAFLKDDKNAFPGFDRAHGRSYGIELFLRKDNGWLTGQISCAWQHNRITIGERTKRPQWDRPLALKGTVGLRLGRTWIFSLAAVHSSGALYHPITGWFMAAGQQENSGAATPDHEFFTEYYIENQTQDARLPAYFRLDIALRKHYQSRFFDWTLYVQAQNLTFHQNGLRIDWQDRFRLKSNAPQNNDGIDLALPVLPSVGIEFRLK